MAKIIDDPRYTDDQKIAQCDWLVKVGLERYHTKMSLRALCRKTIQEESIKTDALPDILQIYCKISTYPTQPECEKPRKFFGPRF